jgi:hypothetical protein
MARPLLLVAAASIAALAADAAAQTGGDGAVRSRNPFAGEYEPIGLGAFKLTSSLAATVGYDANVFFDEDDEVEDGFFETVGDASLDYDRDRYRAVIDATVRDRRFFSETSESATTGNLGLALDYRVDDGTTVALTARAAALTQTRADIESPSATASRIDYDTANLGLAVRHRREAWRLGAALNLARADYDDARDRQGSLLDQDFRDRTTKSAQLSASHVWPSGIALGGEVSHTISDLKFVPGSLNRDSEATRVNLVLTTEGERIMTATARLGWQRRDFEEPTLADRDRLVADMAFRYRPSRLTDLFLDLGIDQQVSTVENQAGVTIYSIGGRVDHEWLPQVILSAGGGYQTYDFERTDREDDVWELSAGVLYHLAAQASLRGDARYYSRETMFDDPLADDILRVSPELSLGFVYRF